MSDILQDLRIEAPTVEGQAEILTPEALEFVIGLEKHSVPVAAA